MNIKNSNSKNKNNIKLIDGDLSKSLTQRSLNFKSKIKKNNNSDNISHSINKDKIHDNYLSNFNNINTIKKVNSKLKSNSIEKKNIFNVNFINENKGIKKTNAKKSTIY